MPFSPNRYELRIALRYLWTARKRVHTAFLSGISMLGLAVGVFTLIISLALLSGLQGEIKSRLIAASPQLLIEPASGTSIADSQKVLADLEHYGFETIRPEISGFAWATNRRAGRGRPVRIGSFPPSGAPLDSEGAIYLTRDLAAAMGTDTGSDIIIVAPRTELTPFGPVPVWKKYRVGGLLPTTTSETDPSARLPFEAATRLFDTGGNPTSISVYTRSLDRVEEAQKQLGAKYGALRFQSWKEINRPLFLALRLEKIVMFLTISLIVFVAALNLVSSLSMMIVEKRPQVGVLRTLGASERSILGIYMTVGLLIGIAGTVLGNVAGLGLAWAANHFHLVPLPQDVYYLSWLPFKIDATDVIGVNLVAIVLSVVATLYPARVASKLDPIAAIREE
ncbi:MAG: FtsX-like permease family protein [Thermoanaerobaculia bacterium]